MTKRKGTNSGISIDTIDDRLENLFMTTVEAFGHLMEKVKTGEIEPTGHLLNTVTTFLERNKALLPDLRERRLGPGSREWSKLYNDLPTFDDDEEWK